MPDRNAVSRWAEMNADILDLIIHKLDIIDFVRFSSTCRSWHSCAKIHRTNCTKTLPPWLLITNTFDLEKLANKQENIESRFSFWSITSRNTYRVPLFPPLNQFYAAVASSNGFLLISDSNYNLQLINPFTGAHFPLPSMTKIVNRFGLYFSQIDKAVIKTHGGSRNPNLIVLIIASTMFWAEVGGQSWMKVLGGKSFPYNVFDECVFDIVYHKDKLHVICASGMYVFHVLVEKHNVPTKLVDSFDMSGRSYLVESPDGDDLFLVVRKANYEGVENKEGWVTMGFMVFRYDENRGMWNEVKDIGEFVLFVGHNSFSVRSGRFSNKIWFVDELGSGGIGVLDLGGGSIIRVDLPVDLRCTERWNAFCLCPHQLYVLPPPLMMSQQGYARLEQKLKEEKPDPEITSVLLWKEGSLTAKSHKIKQLKNQCPSTQMMWKTMLAVSRDPTTRTKCKLVN